MKTVGNSILEDVTAFAMTSDQLMKLVRALPIGGSITFTPKDIVDGSPMQENVIGSNEDFFVIARIAGDKIPPGYGIAQNDIPGCAAVLFSYLNDPTTVQLATYEPRNDG